MFSGKKPDAWQAEPIDFLLLFRGNRAFDPNETFAGAETLAQFMCVDIGKHGGEKFDRFVLVDDSPGLRENRHDLDVGRQKLAVAIEKVGACGGDGVGGRAFDARGRVRAQTEIEQLPRDDSIDPKKYPRREPNAGRALVEPRRKNAGEETFDDADAAARGPDRRAVCLIAES